MCRFTRERKRLAYLYYRMGCVKAKSVRILCPHLTPKKRQEPKQNSELLQLLADGGQAVDAFCVLHFGASTSHSSTQTSLRSLACHQAQGKAFAVVPLRPFVKIRHHHHPAAIPQGWRVRVHHTGGGSSAVAAS